MGMYDHLYCKVPLPGEHPFDSTTEFQTKSLDCVLSIYVIEEDGRLMERQGHYEEVPKEERPYPDDDGFRGMVGALRFVDTGWAPVDVHQRVTFYAMSGDRWFDFTATFTHGQLEGIELSESEVYKGK